MPAGFHDLHLPAVGKCEPNQADPADATQTGDFLSAGGQLAGGGAAHPDHAGDLPVLYVLKDGTGSLTASTDRLTEAQLGQAGGISLIVHAGPDNYGNKMCIRDRPWPILPMIEAHSPAIEPSTTTSSAPNSTLTPSRWKAGSLPPTAGAT